MNCPECGEPLEKRTVARKHRHTSSRYMCHNSFCPVIFVEKKLVVARDPLMVKEMKK